MAAKKKTKPTIKDVELTQYLDRVIDRYDQDIELIQKSYDFSRDAEPGAGATNDLWNEEIKAWADMLTIESLFYTEDWVFILTDLIANKISSQPLYVMQYKQNSDGTKSVEYNEAHPLNALIENPNPMQEYHSWMYNSVVQFVLLGNTIEWYSKQNNWLISLRTALSSIEFAPDGSIKSYMYAMGDEEMGKGATKFDPSSIIHIRRPNPASLMWGLSPFVPGRKSILFNRYTSDYLNAFYLKQATPGMVLEMDRQLNEEQALRQIRSFELAYTGRRNQRRTMLLPKGVKATAMSLSIADQKIVDLVKMNRESIMNLLRVPKQELGLQEAGSLGSEEYKIALRNFWEATLLPTMRLIEGGLNKFFKPQLGPNNFFQFDTSDVEALKEDQMKKATLAKEMLAGGLSVNEVRSKVWDEEPAEGVANDEPFVSVPKTPGMTFGAEPTQTTEPVTEPAIETNPIDQLALTPANGTAKLLGILAKRRSEWKDNYVKTIDEAVGKKQGRKIYDLALEVLTSMAEVAVPIIKANLREVKAADIPSKTRLKKELTKAFDNFEEIWTDEVIKTLRSTVDLGYDQQLEMVFNEKDKEKILALRAKGEGRIREILNERGLESFANISKTHTERIMAEITKAVDANETVDQISKRIADTFADPSEMASKAETIARTETLTAVSVGQGAALRDAAQVIPGLKKAWLNADDARVRDAHLDTSEGGVSGEVVDANDTFSNGLKWPRDTSASDPGQVINCRCTLIMLPPGEDLNV